MWPFKRRCDVDEVKAEKQGLITAELAEQIRALKKDYYEKLNAQLKREAEEGARAEEKRLRESCVDFGKYACPKCDRDSSGGAKLIRNPPLASWQRMLDSHYSYRDSIYAENLEYLELTCACGHRFNMKCADAED